ncbi:MAG: FAD-dependent oxidoreductase [Chloroflexi bacterium]|nr:FAD-dependent oxidoreductase [Chloroflexota bacterium]
MAKPLFLIVDDDPTSLNTLQQDLKQHYGGDYEIRCADSSKEAVKLLNQWHDEGRDVALLLCDQTIGDQVGTDMVRQAKQLFPDLKTILLTTYTDTDAAIEAMNSAGLDYYVMKPWQPPDEKLYPAIDSLLHLKSSAAPESENIRVIGHRWSPEAHQIKDFLARNQVAYEWLDVETMQLARDLMKELGLKRTELPVVLFADGSHLVCPDNLQLAEKVGLQTQAEQPFYDLVIVGAGPSGLAAAVYAASEGLRTVMIEREAPGGQAGTSSRIENYLGFPVGLSGAELTQRAVAQAKRFGVEILAPQEAVKIERKRRSRSVYLADGSIISGYTLLLALGVTYRRLEAPGIERLLGSGVYYGAAMTEAPACHDQNVFVVGAGNSAGQAALYFSRYARQVVMLVRGESLDESMSQYLIDQIGATKNITVRYQTEIVEAHGEEHLDAITVRNTETSETERCPAAALFILIGAVPHTDWLRGTVELDEQGFILTGSDLVEEGERPDGWRLEREPYLLETSIPGVFAAGDVRAHSVKRVASAVGEGAMAVQFIHRYLAEA